VAAGRRGLAVSRLAVFGLAAFAKDPLGALLPPVAVVWRSRRGPRAAPRRVAAPAGVAALLVLGFAWYAGRPATRASPVTVVDNPSFNVAARPPVSR